ncbi:MAG: prepilin-type N-terminal cleavage/methylation domain-containing protein [Elusimicrobiales bacterium]|nr:prepilin-type N-terminal cleavage/methylation domain-containing protein [Elusimicrobiales bacterium]
MQKIRKGFTLIELLVVVLIIGILASMAIPQYFKVVERSRVSEAMSTFAAIKAAQERYYARKSVYSTNWDQLDVTFKTAAGAECTGAAACAQKIYSYALTATGVTATRVGSAPATYGNYVITYNYANATPSCTGNCGRDLIN